MQELQLNSPELLCLERELEEALESHLTEFNDELERHENVSDETSLSIEDDMKMAENATVSVQRLLESDTAEAPSGGVKSLASMFEMHLPPKEISKNYHQDCSESDIGNDNNHIDANHNAVLSESSLSIKEGLAMFGSPARRKPISTTSEVDGSRSRAELDTVHEQQTKSIEYSSSKQNVKTITESSNLHHILAQRKKLIEESNTVALPPAPGLGNHDNITLSTMFTPIKSKELLSEAYTSVKHSHTVNKNTEETDYPTIEQRREVLLQDLKLHLRGRNAVECERSNHLMSEVDLESQSDKNSEIQSDKSPSLENQISKSNQCHITTTSSSPRGFDTINLQDTHAFLSPINEQSNEADSSQSTRQNDSGDSSTDNWILPIVNDFHPKENSQSTRSELTKCRCYYKTLECARKMILLISCLKILVERAVIFLSPCLWFTYNQCRSVISMCFANLLHIFILLANMCQRASLYTKDCVGELSLMSRLSYNYFPMASKTLLRWLAMMSKGTAACLVSITLGLAMEISTVAPRYNCGISVLLWCFQNKPVESKRQSIALSVLVLSSICIDFDWLSSRYTAEPLENEDGGNSFAYRVEQDESLLQTFVWYGLLINIIFKVVSLNYILKSSSRGRFIRAMLSKKFGVFCAVTTSQEDMNEAARAKLIAILWGEIVSLISCFVVFFIIDSKGSSSDLFQDGSKQLLSLQASLLYKGCSGAIVFLSLAHHVRLKDFWMQFGCDICCPSTLQGVTSDRRGRITSTLHRSRKCITIAKLIDLSTGLLLFINLSSVHKEFTRDEPKEIIVLFILLVSVQTFSCIVTPCLGLTVAWWIHTTKNKSSSRERNRHDAMMENTPATHRGRRQRSSQHRHDAKIPAEDVSSNGSLGAQNYDFSTNQIRTTQSLFESRLSAASPVLSATTLSQLDLNVVCSPKEFRRQWTHLPRGTMVSFGINSIPTLSACHLHFQKRRFHVVASGLKGQETKVYLLAQKETTTRCLVEVIFNSGSNEMSAEVRCQDKRSQAFFMGALALKDLI